MRANHLRPATVLAGVVLVVAAVGAASAWAGASKSSVAVPGNSLAATKTDCPRGTALVSQGFGTKNFAVDGSSSVVVRVDSHRSGRGLKSRAVNFSEFDGVFDACDNCPGVPNPLQVNRDGNGNGDQCEVCGDGSLVDSTETVTSEVQLSSVNLRRTLPALLDAGRKGAQIDLIVRGACMLPAQLEGVSDHIRVHEGDLLFRLDGEIEDLVLLIKPMRECVYENMVDMLDELQITGMQRYAMVPEEPADRELLVQQGLLQE